MSAVLTQNNHAGRRGGTSWLVLGAGVLTGLVLVAVITTLLMQPPLAELATLIGTLAVTAVASLAVGYFLYRRGWARSLQRDSGRARWISFATRPPWPSGAHRLRFLRCSGTISPMRRPPGGGSS